MNPLHTIMLAAASPANHLSAASLANTMNDMTPFELPWETLEAVVQGQSSIDLQAAPLQTPEEAYYFVLSYGYDLNSARDQEEVQGFLKDAVSFINRRLLDLENPDLKDAEPLHDAVHQGTNQIPPEVYEGKDALDLLVLASNQSHNSPWACAILKVMHTMAHIHNGPLYQYFDEAKAQILAKFFDMLTPIEEDGTYWLGQPNHRQLKIAGFETKSQKTRESILVKLLCKPQNVAEEVRDLIGVRLITETPAQAILALDILRENKVLLFPNIIPSRSRNTLINLPAFHAAYQARLQAVQEQTVSAQDFENWLADPLFFEHNPDLLPSAEATFNHHNPASSSQYRSIHITGRQLIRLKPGSSPFAHPDRETRFFFPYEIQLLDKASYLESKLGNSSHSTYKRNQLLKARRRILGSLLVTTKI